jgi:hypothetical protein
MGLAYHTASHAYHQLLRPCLCYHQGVSLALSEYKMREKLFKPL